MPQDPDAEQPRRGDDTDYKETVEIEEDMTVGGIHEIPDDDELMESVEVRRVLYTHEASHEAFAQRGRVP